MSEPIAPSAQPAAAAARADRDRLRMVLVMSAVAFAMLVAVASWSLHLVQQAGEAGRWVVHTWQVQLTIGQLRTDLAELGRAVLDALQDDQVPPPEFFAASGRQLDESTRTLLRLVQDKPDQAEAARTVARQIMSHVNALSEVGRLPPEQLPRALQARRERVAAINSQLQAMMQREAQLLVERDARLRDGLKLQTVAVWAASVLAMALLGLALALLWREVRRRRQAEQAALDAGQRLAQLNSGLEQRIDDRAHELRFIGRVRQLRGDLARLLFDAAEAADEQPVLHDWRNLVLQSGLATEVELRLPGQAVVGAVTPDADDRLGPMATVELPDALGVVAYRRLRPAGTAIAGLSRADELVGDLAAWLRMRGIRRARLDAEAQRDRTGKQLATLARQLIRVEERERSDLARELHDDLGQKLAALKIDLGLLKRASVPAAQQVELQSESVALLDACIEQVRSRARRLRPALLSELGLEAALRRHVEQESRRQRAPVAIEVEWPGAPPSDEWAVHVFRIVQEALRNAFAHGQPSRVDLQLDGRADPVRLTITDDGIGLLQAGSTDGLGLLHMRERAEGLGGRFEIGAAPGGGTRLVCSWPRAAVMAAAAFDKGLR